MAGTSYNTKSRQKIMEYLKNNIEKTVTVDDIFCYLQTIGYSVNITTVYRAVERLAGEGKLLKYTTDDGKKSSYQYVDQNTLCHDHLHLQCSECGKIIHLDCDCMKDILAHISAEHDFNIKCNNTILYGQCKDCKRKN